MITPSSDRAPWWAASTPGALDGDSWCGVCGAAIGDDPDDALDTPQESMCAACARAREFDQTLWEQDLADPDAGLW